MFSKRCPRCEEKVKRDFKFCPFCNQNLKSNYDQADYGFLGKDDFIEDAGFIEENSMTDTFMEKMFNSAMKLLEKQMRNIHSEVNDPRQNPRRNFSNLYNHPGLNVQFFVNGEKVFPEKQKMHHYPVKRDNFMSKDKLKRFSRLPKKEPKSRIKRLSGRVIYELLVPGVETIEDVLINQLENSIEVKALSNNKVYSKNLNVNLPILRYSLVDDNLVIEMQAR